MIDYLDDENRSEIIRLFEAWFKHIVHLPNEVRKDYKSRSGIAVLIGNPYNFRPLIFSVGNPSDRARVLSVEKTVRTLLRNSFTSRVTRREDYFMLGGALSLGSNYPPLLKGNDDPVVVSVSGLKEEEDECLAIKGMCHIATTTPDDIFDYIKKSNRSLTRSLKRFFYPPLLGDAGEDHYLRKMLYSNIG